MELLIVICLLFIIFLLLKDKVRLGRKPGQNPPEEITNPELPDIMGQPKPVKSYVSPQVSKTAETLKTAPPQAREEAVAESQGNGDTAVDFSEEEETWGMPGVADSGFATGVTFDELATVGALLSQQQVAPPDKATAIAIAAKMEGTQLVALLESRISDAAGKIAGLLDRSVALHGSAEVRKAKDKDFDISDHI